VKDYCWCGVREKDENQGSQGKDRCEIKSGAFGNERDHGDAINNSSVSKIMCGVFKYQERTRVNKGGYTMCDAGKGIQ